jgi:hypothetical protein
MTLAAGASTAAFIEAEKVLNHFSEKGHDHHHSHGDQSMENHEHHHHHSSKKSSILPLQTSQFLNQKENELENQNWSHKNATSAVAASAMVGNAPAAPPPIQGCCPGCGACPAAWMQNNDSSKDKKPSVVEETERIISESPKSKTTPKKSCCEGDHHHHHHESENASIEASLEAAEIAVEATQSVPQVPGFH